MIKDYNYYKKLGIFDRFQLIVIGGGIKLGLDVSAYAKTEFDHNQMTMIRTGIKEKLNIDYFANSNYSVETMFAIKEILRDNPKKDHDRLVTLFILENS